ncbi:hypothetical protein DNA98_12995 [Meiothermus sp. Pnk-1]|nr:hypothetical protein DNA98_12995 [Meiothermus sp. Pnk-1]
MVRDNGDGTVDVLGHPIWSTGTFFGHGSPREGDTFSADDLEQIATDMRELEDELDPRLYAGHPLHPILKFLARPKGRVRNFRREGNFLLADFLGVPRSFWEQISQDQARFSPDMMVGYTSRRTGKRYPWVVTGLGALGAVLPANTLLPPAGAEYHYYGASAFPSV